MAKTILAENKKGLYQFEVLEKFQAGLKLTGAEVKVAKSGQFNLTGSFVKLYFNSATGKTEAWLVGAQIPKYKKAGYGQNSYDPARNRKLLLKRQEINSLIGKTRQKTLTIIPITVYNSEHLIKLEIGLAKGKKQFDKREIIKKREFARSKQRLLKRI